MTIDRILVAVSFSERSIDAVRRAARLAADRGSSITLLHVVEPVKRISVGNLPAQRALVRARASHGMKELARYAGEIAARDRLPVDFRIEVGEKVASILRACEDADVLFIVGAPMSGLAAAFHMTTAERLVGRCGIPILVVKGPPDGGCARALVPADGSYRSVAGLSVAARLWPRAELTLLDVTDSRQEGHPLRITRALAHLEELAARAQVAARSVAFRIGHGDAARAVQSMQEEMAAQVVVMTKRKVPSLAYFVLGNTIRRLLTKLPCDLLVVPEHARQVPLPIRIPSGRRASIST